MWPGKTYISSERILIPQEASKTVDRSNKMNSPNGCTIVGADVGRSVLSVQVWRLSQAKSVLNFCLMVGFSSL